MNHEDDNYERIDKLSYEPSNELNYEPIEELLSYNTIKDPDDSFSAESFLNELNYSQESFNEFEQFYYLQESFNESEQSNYFQENSI
ncbi:1874_t:CDS:2, partial [Gigaspora rosea]